MNNQRRRLLQGGFVAGIGVPAGSYRDHAKSICCAQGMAPPALERVEQSERHELISYKQS